MIQTLGTFFALLLFLNPAPVRSGPAFKASSALQDVDVWTNANANWFQYPEAFEASNYFVKITKERPNFGIAVSGGGFRAATLALGYFRALHLLNISQQARYLSSNSGGSWFNSAYSFQQSMAVDEFLGPYVKPQDLSMDALEEVRSGSHGSFAATITKASIITSAVTRAVADVVTGSLAGPGAWSQSVGAAFLEPYNLNSDKSTITANGTKGPIHAALKQLDGVEVYTYQAEHDEYTESHIPRPFPIVLGSIFSRANGSSEFYPVEFTPLYIGCPPVFMNNTHSDDTVGGGFVDPQGFNSAPPDQPPRVPDALRDNAAAAAAVVSNGNAAFSNSTDNNHRSANATIDRNAADGSPVPQFTRRGDTEQSVTAAGAEGRRLLVRDAPARASRALAAAMEGDSNVTDGNAAAALNAELPLQTAVDSRFIVPLKVMTGISSSFLAQGLRPDLAGTLAELTGTEDLEYWNQVDFKGQRQPFADGGGTDNLAVTPLLRRQVSTIIACIAAVTPVKPDTNIDDFAVEQWDIAALFGAVPLEHENMRKGKINGMTPQQANAAAQVFPTSGFTDLFKSIQSGVAAGGPVYHMAEYTVVDNPLQAVRGGWKVHVLWVPNSLQRNWESQLPSDTQGSLAQSRYKKGGLFEGDKTMRQAAPNEGDDESELKMFPYISTFDANYGPELTGLLSQMATWQMFELKPQLEQLLGPTGVTVLAEPSNVMTSSGGGVVAKRCGVDWLLWIAGLVAVQLIAEGLRIT